MNSFKICNGIKQGGNLSLKLFSVYVDDLITNLINSKVGCYIDDNCINHVMYADDICLMTQSPGALQTLIDNCYTYMYSLHNDLPFNSSKSVCVVFKHRLYKCLCPELFMSTQYLNYVNDTKYLGVTLSCDKLDDKDMLRHFRLLYAKSYRLLRMYQQCSYKVKLALIHSYCTCLHYPYFIKSLHCIVLFCIVL